MRLKTLLIVSASFSASSFAQELTGSDWQDIRAAYAEARHSIQEAGQAHVAENPGNGLHLRFEDGRTRVDGNELQFELRLSEYGWSDSFAMGTPRLQRAEGVLLEYVWDERLTEWYVNQEHGVKHGFTLDSRPALATGDFHLTLGIPEGWTIKLDRGGRDVGFYSTGGAELRYDGLVVFDADGAELEAGFEAVDGGVRLTVCDQGATYPITIDPTLYMDYFKASNTDPGDGFGFSVDLHDWGPSGVTAVIGAPSEDSCDTGVNPQGNGLDNSCQDSGAVYVFRNVGAGWNLEAYIKPNVIDTGDRFGHDVAISGNNLIIGAPQEDSCTGGINSDSGNNACPSAGAVYIFHRLGSVWSLEAYIKPDEIDTNDQFGYSVAIQGSTAVVGAPGEDSSSVVINTGAANNGASETGAAYVFTTNTLIWSQQAYLKSPLFYNSGLFGWDVSFYNNRAVVGQPNYNVQEGAAIVFERIPISTWLVEQVLTMPGGGAAGDSFGLSVAIAEGTIGIGAPGTDLGPDSNVGTAWVYGHDGLQWNNEGGLTSSHPEDTDRFGTSVAAEDGLLLVGVPFDDSGSAGVDADASDSSAPDSGAAFLFQRGAGVWGQIAYLKSQSPDAQDDYGRSVAMSGALMFVGAPEEDSSATLVNGNFNDNSALDAGAAYLYFNDPCEEPITYCPLSPNSAGPGARIGYTGSVSHSANDFVLTVIGCPANQFGLFFYGPNQTQNVLGNGWLCVTGGLTRLPVIQTDGNGHASFALDLGNLPTTGPIQPGDEVNFQFWFRDPPAGGAKYDLSNALNVKFCP